jgi:ribosomal protein L11 methyltransferase
VTNSAPPGTLCSGSLPGEKGIEYIEITVETDNEAAEAVSAVFSEYSQTGPVVEELWSNGAQLPTIRVKTFVPAEHGGSLPRIEEALWHLRQIYPFPAPTIRWLSQADWAQAWKADYTVQHIGRHIVIKPSWQSHAASADEVVVDLDPGLAFGTGMHPSTRLCLLALEDYLRPGDRVLDAGTGSGILAIAAVKMGAGSASALDIDRLALETARANLVRNGVQEKVSLQRASLCPVADSACRNDPVPTFQDGTSVSKGFDLVLMNILAEAIIQCAAGISACLSAEGRFIVSGIIEPQEESVRQALAAVGLSVSERRAQGDWVALCGCRSNLQHNRKEFGQGDQAP